VTLLKNKNGWLSQEDEEKGNIQEHIDVYAKKNLLIRIAYKLAMS
jgi:hypothetical protein